MKHCPNPECRGLKKFRIISEYEDAVEVCADCGADLVPGPAPQVPDKDPLAPSPDPDLELATLVVTRNESELLVLQSLLEAAGIPYLCRGEQIQDLFGFGRLVAVNPITGPVEVQVPATDLPAAQRILAEREENHD
ncbi:MAG: DUF2007 domain-containing protein [bacterium]|nr:DUF2007 domain-containing protein [bacterium]